MTFTKIQLKYIEELLKAANRATMSSDNASLKRACTPEVVKNLTELKEHADFFPNGFNIQKHGRTMEWRCTLACHSILSGIERGSKAWENKKDFTYTKQRINEGRGEVLSILFSILY